MVMNIFKLKVACYANLRQHFLLNNDHKSMLNTSKKLISTINFH